MELKKIYHNPFLSGIFHTLIFCLQKELSDCESVLDLGCGPDSPLQYCGNVKYSVGVEAFRPYLDESKKKRIHTKYLWKKIENLNFPDKSFEAVIMIEVLEHLPKELGDKILRKADDWARKKVIISTPNGFFPMENVDQNQWQKHLSGWTIEKFKRMGFSVKGLAGVKLMYKGTNQVCSMKTDNEQNLYMNIRFNPKKFFYILNAFFQIFTYYLPFLSFELLAVKKQSEK